MNKLMLASASGLALAIAYAAMPALAQSTCGSVSPSTSTDMVALQADADCFGKAAAIDQTQATADQSQIATAQGQVTTTQAQIDALAAQLATLNSQIAALTADIAAQGSAASSAQAAQQARLARITYLKSLPPPVVWTKCANEGQTCYVVGTANVRYGANGKYVTKSVTGSIACSNGIFGDPIFGTVKTCDTDGKVGSAPAPVPVPTPAPAPAPMPMPSPTGGFDAAADLNGAPAISITDFDTSLGKVKAGIPGTAAPDNVGAFRFICGSGQVLRDDPVVFPGQPGKSHIHQFYGNVDANAYSTHASLLAHGHSTCSGPLYPLNRSAYWMPALLDGKGNVLRPDYIAVYYKRYPGTSPLCHSGGAVACVSIPNGLKFIAGRDMTNLAAPTTGYLHFLCQTTGGLVLARSNTMDGALQNCPVGAQFSVGVDAPSCWDGKYLDTPDHRSHVSYGCDANHHYLIPDFSLGPRWTIMPGDDTTKWSFSCDSMTGDIRGNCYHMDYFEAWDPATKNEWTNLGCVANLLTCTGADLGDGFRMTGGYTPNHLLHDGTFAMTYTNPERVIPITSIP